MQVEKEIKRAEVLLSRGNLVEGVGAVHAILRRYPGNRKLLHFHKKLCVRAPNAWLHSAQLFLADGQADRARQMAEQRLEIAPDAADALTLVAVSKIQTGDFAGAVADLQRLVSLLPKNADAYFNLAHALRQAGDFAQASKMARIALTLHPKHRQAWNCVGQCQMELGQYGEAVGTFRRVVELWPKDASAHTDLSLAYAASGDAAAIPAFERALSVDPTHVPAWNGLGYCYLRTGQKTGAQQAFENALTRAPDDVSSHYGIAHVWLELGEFEAAADHLERVLRFEPDHDEARASLLYARARICDWDAMADHMTGIVDLGLRDDRPVSPFSLIPFDDDPDRLLRRAEAFARHSFKHIERKVFVPPAKRPDRLRVGYFSCDFHDHATMYLMAGMFEALDCERFAPVIFSYGGPTNGAMAARLSGTGLEFHDVSALSDDAIVTLVRNQSLDVAIDLKGYTQGNRVNIFAYGLAPLQVHFLGYPGSLGCEFMDVFLADRHILSDRGARAFKEAVYALPHSYQVNDNKREISEIPSRKALGLAADTLVLAAFNDPYKITPEVFSTWATILAAAPNAVLWLYAPHDVTRRNLTRHGARLGIDPTRLVFADRRPQAAHLARLSQADLFLDTFPCSAHTTASDALWAGVPIVTQRGESLQSRVASSLLAETGLSDLITDSTNEYRRLVLRLLTHPEELSGVKTRLKTTLPTAPLFDTSRFVAGFEDALDDLYDRYCKGQPLGNVPRTNC